MYRLYIDETGNADLEASKADANHRYLSLTGIIIDQGYAGSVVYPKLEAVKGEFFGSHPDEPVVLHRKEILSGKAPFTALRDPQRRAEFDAAFIKLLKELDFKVITAVIDKAEHLDRYAQWQHDPYHYCLEVLVERYCNFLRIRGARGDVMGEARGGKFDRKLEECYSRYYARGTSAMGRAEIQQRLTTKALKLKPKTANIAGLQIADAIAHPSAIYVRSIFNDEPPPVKFAAAVTAVLTAGKYRASWQGKINGYGIKWLP